MSFILAGALQGLGQGLMEQGAQRREEVRRKLEMEQSLELYRAKKEIDQEFRTGRGGGSVRTTGGRRRGGGSTTGTGRTQGGPRLGPAERLTTTGEYSDHARLEQVFGDLDLPREHWESYKLDAARRKGGGSTITEIIDFYRKNPGVFTKAPDTQQPKDEGMLKDAYRYVTGTQPPMETVPGGYTGEVNRTAPAPAAMLSPPPEAPAAPPADNGFGPATGSPAMTTAPAQPQSAPPAPQDPSQRKVGQTYTGPNGQLLIWRGNGWEPV